MLNRITMQDKAINLSLLCRQVSIALLGRMLTLAILFGIRKATQICDICIFSDSTMCIRATRTNKKCHILSIFSYKPEDSD